MIQSLRLAALPVLAVVLFAVGESLPDGGIVLKFITELGAFGFLVWFCWYGVSRVIPRMDDKYSQRQEKTHEESEAQRKHYGEVIDKLMERQDQDRVANRDVLQELIRHCAKQGERGQS
ncbi:MAG TPA: hypothetical protein VMY37_04360 [Thermoguttaceae bacterium]|nr:hypothetical protein [Thermoguttaceae bacterium]